MKRKRDIIFFTDYGLWMQCQKECLKIGSDMYTLISNLIRDTVSDTYKGNLNLNIPEVLYAICEEEGAKQKLTVAEYLEACCRKKFNIPLKLKPWELPKG